MKVFQRACPGILLGLFFHVLATPPATAQTFSNYPASSIHIVELQGKVELFRPPAKSWTPAQTNQTLQPFDRLRTANNSRVALRWSDQSVVPFGASTELEILPPQNADSQAGLHLVRGVLSFFHRDKPGRIQIITRGATAGIEGTEFVLAANDAGQTTMSVIDGKVRFASAQTSLLLTNGQQAIAKLNQPPVQTAGFRANHVLQWCFYYPAVIDLSELNLNSDTQSALTDSLAAYRSGDLLQALAKYPANRQPASAAEQIYHAALLLSVGQVEPAESALAALPADDAHAQALANALRELIAAVKHDSFSTTLSARNAPLASERLAASYYEQSRNVRHRSLESALKLARQAVAQSPDFAFGWERVAELEFSFGNISPASDALEKTLALAPRNAQALALQGFLLSAKGQTTDAITAFNRALEIDAALGNAWLGRGLCRIRRGEIATGREDLLIAAALEPQRAALRSYLGKSFGDSGDFVHADRELDLAKTLDPGDPTPWLYSAVVNQQNNRVNDAIRDLEKSLELNDNRSVYRSQLLIEQDHAMRSANLAQIYSDAGFTDLGMREASRAVSYDYANYSAHWFLANSYEEMRGNFVNLRYETPAFTEYLVANLLAPVDAGPLSPAISQSEYTRLFNQNGFGVYSDTQYLSRGAWSQSFAQYGTFDTFNYTLEAAYLSDPGQYRNNDLENKQLSLSLKQQITAQDSIYFRVDGAKLEGGDLSQHYSPADVSPDHRTKEEQIPNLTLGYHHEWSPGVHTLLLLGRQRGEGNAKANIAGRLTSVFEGNAIGLRTFGETLRLQTRQELYSAELQQIFQEANHSTILGALYQHNDFDLRDFETTEDGELFPYDSGNPPLQIASLNVNTRFQRTSVYGYHSWQILDPLLLVGGLSYDRIELPRNWNAPPVSDRQTTKDQVSPKAGLVWTPGKNTTIRAAYTRSLSGASLDQSFRIEPSQVAGLNQSFRSLMSESLVGATSGARFETFGLSLEQKFPTGTYIGLRGELLYSDVSRGVGTYIWDGDADDPWSAEKEISVLGETLHSRERSVVFTLDQLIDREWTVGLRYRLTQVELDQKFTESFAAADPISIYIPLGQHVESLLHQVNLHANFNHASGFFASFEAVWYLQDNTGFGSTQPGDEFWHFNLLGGYRFFHRRAMIEAGILNLSDQDYRLNPLVWHDEPPRERTFVARLQFNF